MIYIVLLFVLFLVGIPICFSLGLVSIFGMVQGATPMIVVIQRLFTGADSTALIAIPLFILAGGLMVQGGISNRIVSFADACSCGDGTIYRASNFVLTGIKENLNLAELPDGTRIHKMTLASNPTTPRRELGGLTFFDVTGGTYNFKKYLDYVGATPIPGFQLRYIYFIDKAKRKDLTVPEIPFSKIDEMGAGMYKGEKVSQASRHVDAPG